MADDFECDHVFALKKFSHLTFCALCGEFIWGQSKEGYDCQICNDFPVHKNCLVEAKSANRPLQKKPPTKSVPPPPEASLVDLQESAKKVEYNTARLMKLENSKKETTPNKSAETILVDSRDYEDELTKIKEQLEKEKERTEQLLLYKSELKRIQDERKALGEELSDDDLSGSDSDDMASYSSYESVLPGAPNADPSVIPPVMQMPYLTNVKTDLQNEYKKYGQYKSPLPNRPQYGSLTKNSPGITPASSVPPSVPASANQTPNGSMRDKPEVVHKQIPSHQSTVNDTQQTTSGIGSAVKLVYNSLGGNANSEPQRPTSPKIERAKKIMKNNILQNQQERLDSIVGLSPRKTSTPLKEEKQALVEAKNKLEDTNIIRELSYQIARGETSKVKKKVTKMLNKVSSRKLLLEAVDESGQTILHLAVDGMPTLIKLLVEKKMDINKPDKRGWSPLAYAAMKGDEYIFMELLNLGAIPDQTVLHYFCSHFCSQNCEQLLKTMIEKGVDINGVPPNSTNGDRPIHSAVVNARENLVEGLNGSVLMVELLIKMGAKNNKGDTALHWAVYTDKSRIAKLLIIAGADLTLQGSEGFNPVEMAAKKPNSSVAYCLRHAQEAKQFLKGVEFHTKESYSFIFRKFVEEEIGEAAFKALTMEIFTAMGIKNAGDIAVLLSTQEKLKTKQTGTNEQFKLSKDNLLQPKNTNNLKVEKWFSMLPNGLDYAKRLRKGNTNVPNLDEDKTRLQLRLDQYKLRKRNYLQAADPFTGLVALWTSNCLFYSVSDQLFDSTEQYNEIRSSVCDWLKKNSGFLKVKIFLIELDWKFPKSNIALIDLVLGTIPSTSNYKLLWEDYANSMQTDAWGDAATLVAISEVYGCKIFVISSVEGSEYIISVTPSKFAASGTKRTVLLSHIRELNFDSLAQVVENPMFSDWNEEFNINIKELKLVKKVGEGSSGEIYKGNWKGIEVAAKKIYKNLLEGETFDRFRAEISMLKKFRHPNIILFLGICVDKSSDLFIVTEYMDLGNLKDFLRAHADKGLDWNTRLKMAMDIAQGMNYLHSLIPVVIHRDLKSSNILVDKAFNLKISDFGVARFFEEQEQYLKTFVSTLAWTAPEIFNAEGYTEKVDVYSYSIVLWELLTCRLPYSNISEQQVILGVAQKGLRPTIPLDCPEDYASIMKESWHENPKNRPKFEEILTRLRNFSAYMKDETARERALVNTPRSESGSKTPSRISKNLSASSSQYNFAAQKLFFLIDYGELQYDEGRSIGSGKSAYVYKGLYRNQEVAIKVLKETPTAEQLVEFQKELEVWAKIRVPHLVFFYGACLSPKCCLITEFCEKGTLYQLMNDPNVKIEWKDVIKYSIEIARGIYYLHSWRPPIVHRDIKSSNMLLDRYGTIKLCDLGLARFVSGGNSDITLYKCKGTPVYIAPEVYHSALELEDKSKGGNLHKSDSNDIILNSTGHTTKSDVYSFAVVLWELVTRTFTGTYRTPYYSDNKGLHDAAILIQVARKSLRPLILADVPTQFSALIQWCWNQDPAQRPEFDAVIEHLNHIETDYKQNESKWQKKYKTAPK